MNTPLHKVADELSRLLRAYKWFIWVSPNEKDQIITILVTESINAQEVVPKVWRDFPIVLKVMGKKKKKENK